MIKIVQAIVLIFSRLTAMYEQHRLKQDIRTAVNLEILEKRIVDQRHRQAVSKRSRTETARQNMRERYAQMMRND